MRPRPIPPERPRGSPVTKLFLLCLLGVGVYGGYYGYCSYKVNGLEYTLSGEAQDLHQALMRLAKNVNADDVRTVVTQMASRAGVTPGTIQVVIEPMTAQNMGRLPAIAQTAMGMAARIPGEKQANFVVGFKGTFSGKHGVARRTFELERYTWFQWVEPGAVTNSNP